MSENFTLEHYKTILLIGIENGYNFICFDTKEFNRSGFSCLLRHDIDSELWSCLKMAELENSLGINATYFLMLRSTSYNLLCKESIQAVEKILDLGHKIGLHYMGELTESLSEEDLVENVLYEADLLKTQFGEQINAVSFHQPSQKVLNSNLKFRNLINTYNKNQMSDFFYFSDTNMKWKSGNPQDIFSSKKHRKLQFLVHPIWWTKSEKDVREKWIDILEKNREVIVNHWKKRERSLKNIKL